MLCRNYKQKKQKVRQSIICQNFQSFDYSNTCIFGLLQCISIKRFRKENILNEKKVCKKMKKEELYSDKKNHVA